MAEKNILLISFPIAKISSHLEVEGVQNNKGGKQKDLERFFHL